MEKMITNSGNFKCTRTKSGRYTLYCADAMGKMRRVRGIGFASQPFQIVAQYPNTPYVAVRRTVMTPRGAENKLYLVNTKTGEMPDQTRDGFKSIVFDSGSKTFYFSQSENAYFARYAQYLAMKNNGMTNIPAMQYANVTTAGTPIMVAPIVRKRRRKRVRRTRGKLRGLRRLRVAARKLRRARKPRTIAKAPATKSAAAMQLTVPYALRATPTLAYAKPVITNSAAPRAPQPQQHISPEMMRMLILQQQRAAMMRQHVR
ncbi:MAG TPA: hypothetical protein DD611_00015 [Alphaproteobacteria bacterium]|nr:hypothetical protein [Alphaproteobacteria bacterium]